VQYSHIAVVLGLCPNGLGVIRSLGKQGIRVIGLDYKPGGFGFYTRYLNVALLCPNPIREPKAMCDYLLNLGSKTEGNSVLFPASDEFVLFISRFRYELEKKFLFALPSDSTTELLMNKRWQYSLLADSGVTIPQTFYPESLNDVKMIQDIILYPAIVKPCYTHIWKEKGFTVKGFIVNDRFELRETIESVFDNDLEVAVQSIIPGPVTNLYEVCCYLNKKSEPLCVFIKRKIRQYPNDAGVGSMVESIRLDSLASEAVKVFQRIRYHGIGEIEYKLDPRDSHFKMIEMNARITLQNSLADYCGINFPLVQYQDLIGINPKYKSHYKEKKRWLWIEMDYESFKALKKEKKISWLRWLKSVIGCRTFAVISCKDIKPFMKFVSEAVRKKIIFYIKKLRKNAHSFLL